MEMSGEYEIPAEKKTVWDALNDPEVLKACIPGCDSLDKTSETELAATVTSKIGPVKAKFKGAVTLSNIDEPNGYTITGEGNGGVAGFAKGGADVALTDTETGTLLTYTAKAQVGGKLAQIGSRLVDAAAKKMADEFFSNFADHVGGGGSREDEDASDENAGANDASNETAESGAPSAGSAQASSGQPMWTYGLIVAIVIAIAVAVYYF